MSHPIEAQPVGQTILFLHVHVLEFGSLLLNYDLLSSSSRASSLGAICPHWTIGVRPVLYFAIGQAPNEPRASLGDHVP